MKLQSLIRLIVLFFVITLFGGAVGFCLSGAPQTALWAGFVAMGASIGVYLLSPQIAVRVTRTAPLSLSDQRSLSAIGERVSMRLGTGAPRFLLIPTADRQVFSLGSGVFSGVIALSQGVLDSFTEDELAAVICLEMVKLRSGYTGLLLFRNALFWGAGRALARSSLDMVRGNTGELSFRGGASGLLRMGTLVALAPMDHGISRVLFRKGAELQFDRQVVAALGNRIALVSALRKMRNGSTNERSRTADPRQAASLEARISNLLENP